MSYRRLVATAIAITPSGALSPGPLSATAIALGASLGEHAGLFVALGHASFELPYIMLLSRAMGGIEAGLGKARGLLGLFASGFMAFFALGLLKFIIEGEAGLGDIALPTFNNYMWAYVAGVAFTAFNPYFLLWWLTVGSPLITSPEIKVLKGLAVAYAAHVRMNYVWLYALSMGGSSAKFLGSMFYKVVLAVAALALFYFSVTMAVKAVKELTSR